MMQAKITQQNMTAAVGLLQQIQNSAPIKTHAVYGEYRAPVAIGINATTQIMNVAEAVYSQWEEQLQQIGTFSQVAEVVKSDRPQLIRGS